MTECTGDSCPIDHTSMAKEKSAAASCPVDHSSMSSANVSAAALSHDSDTASSDPPRVCPVDHNNPKTMEMFLDPSNQMPAVPEQTPSRGQLHGLSTQRTISSIPRASRYEAAGKSECPAVDVPGQSGSKDMWVYPSEQMFFNAMRRKNWNPQETDMKTVVPIHNAVNEKCWMMIMEWEARYKTQCARPMLLKFEGKSKELTPKARLRSLFGYHTPFDRHDWTVDRCGKPVRYIIDFYEGKKDPKHPEKPSFFLDVRPALTLEGAWDRVRRFWGF
ncbi:Cytochrome c1 heme lyase [Coemansia sp. Benny D115]|nr:Cytochrome c1 heme lyase [Coemansia sp. Benny D115]